jgi:hypothetical protein
MDRTGHDRGDSVGCAEGSGFTLRGASLDARDVLFSGAGRDRNQPRLTVAPCGLGACRWLAMLWTRPRSICQTPNAESSPYRREVGRERNCLAAVLSLSVVAPPTRGRWRPLTSTQGQGVDFFSNLRKASRERDCLRPPSPPRAEHVGEKEHSGRRGGEMFLFAPGAPGGEGDRRPDEVGRYRPAQGLPAR